MFILLKKMVLSSMLVGLASLMTVTPVLAVSEATSGGNTQRCQNLTARISTQIARYQNNQSKHQATWDQIVQRLSSLADKLDAKGYDTAQIRTDSKTLAAKISKFSQDYAVFITDLQATQAVVCGSSQGAFKQAAQTAKTQMQAVVTDRVDVRNFYQTVIRKDIQALRTQKSTTVTPAPSQPQS